jgi:hypothetical protein
VFQGLQNIAVPLRKATKSELDKMEMEGSIKRCSPGPWGSPIIVVTKRDTQVRVCRDFSQSVNPFLAVGGRAFPQLDDLSLVNGRYFCVLDLAQAYLQLRLGSASQEVLEFRTDV